MTDAPFRLTALAHGGGCGCKLAPSVLQQLLAGAARQPFANLLVGAETSDDAAVWKLNDETCLIATTDFFMPIVDDPRDFGRIAATNALSDIFAMGGTPLFALAILGMPVDKIPIEIVRQILAGGADACAFAGVPIAGGHSIDSAEPIYGLAVVGQAHPSSIRRNMDARPGDVLILTKPIGVGVYSAAFKKGALSRAAYAEMIATTTQLNAIGAQLAKDKRVRAMTDVTGFGLIGHALEMAQGAQATIVIDASAAPLLAETKALAKAGFVTGASGRNWTSCAAQTTLPADCPEWARQILCDPQTSGGLLIACARDASTEIIAATQAAGFAKTAIVGAVEAGPPRILVRGAL
ncbi:MAG: selenide, water dikinase SelD [Hyphomicrobiales bacterium]|nr:selenide, water dikinase SelD [Hyphomicrobiales bacterium]